jgi:hypothetical protein
MSSWGNTDAPGTKPKWDVERQTRKVIQLTVASTVTNSGNGNNTITFTYSDGVSVANGGSNVANVGVSVGQYVYASNLSSNGVAGFFSSNNTVLSISGNTVTFSSNVFGTVLAGSSVEFDKSIVYKANSVANTYFADTILVTSTRAANANNVVANTGNFSAGWVHVQKKTNNDGTVRYLKETLVALANSSSSNTSSGNTSFGQIVSGL